jgi:hypothetical protein
MNQTLQTLGALCFATRIFWFIERTPTNDRAPLETAVAVVAKSLLSDSDTNDDAISIFCLPFLLSEAIVDDVMPEVYSCVRTDAQGCRQYGFIARWREQGRTEFICCTTYYGDIDIFSRVLLELHNCLAQGGLAAFVACATFMVDSVPVPGPGVCLELRSGCLSRRICMTGTDSLVDLPPAGFPFSLLFAHVSVSSVLAVLSALLLERRVLVVSEHVALLTPACEALLALLYPMTWPFVYIPVLPPQLLEILGCDAHRR